MQASGAAQSRGTRAGNSGERGSKSGHCRIHVWLFLAKDPSPVDRWSAACGCAGRQAEIPVCPSTADGVFEGSQMAINEAWDLRRVCMKIDQISRRQVRRSQRQRRQNLPGAFLETNQTSLRILGLGWSTNPGSAPVKAVLSPSAACHGSQRIALLCGSSVVQARPISSAVYETPSPLRPEPRAACHLAGTLLGSGHAGQDRIPRRARLYPIPHGWIHALHNAEPKGLDQT
jgi:hypothetical protein